MALSLLSFLDARIERLARFELRILCNNTVRLEERIPTVVSGMILNDELAMQPRFLPVHLSNFIHISSNIAFERPSMGQNDRRE